MEPIRVAALSPPIVPGDKERNLASAEAGMRAAAGRGVELAVFSEWYLTHCIADLDPERFISRRTDANYPLKKRRPELYVPITGSDGIG